MAVADGIYGVTIQDIYDATQLAVSVPADTFKLGLVTDTYAPNFNTHAAYADITNEITGSGYTAGGNALTTPTFAANTPAGYVRFDAVDRDWTSATFSSAEGAFLIDDTLTVPADPLLSLTDFGAPYGVTSGTFTVQFDTNGIWRFKYDPAAA